MEQAGPAYEARVFLNNPEADATTPLTAKHGYAGSFHVYGLGVAMAKKAAIDKSVIATEAVRAATSQVQDVIVTVVPVYAGNRAEEAHEPMTFDDVRIVLK